MTEVTAVTPAVQVVPVAAAVKKGILKNSSLHVHHLTVSIIFIFTSVDLLQELTNEMRIAVAEAEQEVFQKFHHFSSSSFRNLKVQLDTFDFC